jgi:hypothetical protein
MDTMIQPATSAQIVEKEQRQYKDYKEPYNWPGLQTKLLTSAGTIKDTHLAPLGTSSGGGSDGTFQTRNFDLVFLAALTQRSLPTARTRGGTTRSDDSIMGLNVTARDFALTRRRTIHRRQVAEGEAGAVGLGQPLKEELQNLLMNGGSLGAAIGHAENYFDETLKLSAAHQEYKVDPLPTPRIEDSRLVIDYTYASDANPAKKTFTVSVGMPDINGTELEHTVTGDNLVAKEANTRGQLTVSTTEGGQVEDATERIRLERSHLIADWFQGTGYRDGLNIIHTSRDFNQVTMSGVESQLARTLSGWDDQYRDQFVNMRLTVKATYEVLDHQKTANQVRELITQANASELVADKAEVAQQLYDILRGKQAPRLCREITYEGEIYLGNQMLLEVVSHTIGPDEFRTEPL